jgi:hypothetical protein|tara:strand:- start:526 stop:672 length:147 start_codon:yes stop_codon:yes gene_type:complete
MLNKTDYYTLLGRIAELEADIRSLQIAMAKKRQPSTKSKQTPHKDWSK